MGIKGDKSTPEGQLSAELLIERLTPIGGITAKKMFGGHGIFHEGKMFCIVDSKGQSFLRMNDTTRSEYEAAGAHQHSRMPYFSIPESVQHHPETLIEWAKKAIAISK